MPLGDLDSLDDLLDDLNTTFGGRSSSGALDPRPDIRNAHQNTPSETLHQPVHTSAISGTNLGDLDKLLAEMKDLDTSCAAHPPRGAVRFVLQTSLIFDLNTNPAVT
mmetsp:Transcript_29813/g.57286  ORF Transcript_29813/g.57286 Transcript_29813/m.57286 type:complete len:107 (+) Transcript_29813:352-672(+)